MAKTVADQTRVADKPACSGSQRFGRSESPISVDAAALMDCEAVLMDAVNEMPEGHWRARFSQILTNLRDSIASNERIVA